MMPLAQLRLLMGDVDISDAHLSLLWDMAEEYVLGYCRRTNLPAGLTFTTARIAAILYERMGAETEQSRSEGSVSATFYPADSDIPASIRDVLNSYRKAGIPGAVT